MIVFYGSKGWGEVLWQGMRHCENCGAETSHHLMKIGKWVSIMFIPCIKTTEKYKTICGKCGCDKDIPRKEFKKEYVYRMNHLDEIPDEIVAHDFTPEKTKLVGRSVLLGFWVAFSLFLLISDPGMLALLIFFLPYIIGTVGNFRDTIKKHKRYKQVCAK